MLRIASRPPRDSGSTDDEKRAASTSANAWTRKRSVGREKGTTTTRRIILGESVRVSQCVLFDFLVRARTNKNTEDTLFWRFYMYKTRVLLARSRRRRARRCRRCAARCTRAVPLLRRCGKLLCVRRDAGADGDRPAAGVQEEVARHLPRRAAAHLRHVALVRRRLARRQPRRRVHVARAPLGSLRPRADVVANAAVGCALVLLLVPASVLVVEDG